MAPLHRRARLMDWIEPTGERWLVQNYAVKIVHKLGLVPKTAQKYNGSWNVTYGGCIR